MPVEVRYQLKRLQLNSLSVLHLNIRSMKKNFDGFQDFIDFIEDIDFSFSVICLSETWLLPHKISDLIFQLPRYDSFHLTREKIMKGGLCMFHKKRFHTNSENTYK